ncbi:unnamed protein product [Adineta steineri]|uniref:C2HC/C3H-type domain-containing protein n=1 Tax=Adineta steineri TaxID=433720 RepID=A0A818JWF2_9BILA|nr:unnamed protein product [Adineta steineri]CAF3547020.1 unnamed protein product [Adineta steineri]
MDDNLTEFPTRRLRLQPCQFCGRQFNSETLPKHQTICRKVSNKKRKTFDAGKQRATDSDVPYKATKQTAQIYQGEIRPQDERSKYGRKPNWREKHNQLIKSIREARHVTRAMKEGGPLPAFRPSEVPSDYANCPYCHRNFNRHAAERHIPFCQAQHERKHGKNIRPNPQYDRGRTLPPQQPTQYRDPQLYRTSTNADSHDIYNNGYKHSNSAPMITRRPPPDYRQAPPSPPPQPPPRKTTSGEWGGFRKLFGLGSKQDPPPQPPQYSSHRYSNHDDDDYYDPPTHRSQQKPVLMRTGRTQENTNLNVHARQRSDGGGVYLRHVKPEQYAPSSYSQPRQQQYASSSYSQPRRQQQQQYAPSSYSQPRQQQQQQQQQQYSNNQYSFTRPTAVGRSQQVAIQCGDCGSIFKNLSARNCPHCGSRC